MLSYREDVGVFKGEAEVLWLNNVQIMTLGMWSWVAGDKIVCWVCAGMEERDGEGEGVWVVFY